MTTQRDPALKVDDQGNVYAEGVKICRVDAQRGVLFFLDKDRRRAAQRGSDQVTVPIAALVGLGGLKRRGAE